MVRWKYFNSSWQVCHSLLQTIPTLYWHSLMNHQRLAHTKLVVIKHPFHIDLLLLQWCHLHNIHVFTNFKYFWSVPPKNKFNSIQSFFYPPVHMTMSHWARHLTLNCFWWLFRLCMNVFELVQPHEHITVNYMTWFNGLCLRKPHILFFIAKALPGEITTKCI